MDKLPYSDYINCGGGRKLFQKVIDVTLGLCKYVETTCGFMWFRDHALTNQIAETIFFQLTYELLKLIKKNPPIYIKKVHNFIYMF